MSRVVRFLSLVLLLGACAGSDLPTSVPVITLPDAGNDGGFSDAGAPDSGPPDSGAAFVASCADAGCDVALCEPLDGGAVNCGVACGATCAHACQTDRCNSSGWVDAFCTNVGGALTWAASPACDDGNVCTIDDSCAAGACKGTPAPTSTSCDDGNVCTTGDHCDGNGGCAGTAAASIEDRYVDGVDKTYAYAAPGGWAFTGWAGDGAIFAEVPGAGTRALHLLFDNSAVDRIISFEAASGTYADTGTSVGTALDHAESGAIELMTSSYTCSGGSESCNAKLRHYFYTPGHGTPPGGTPTGAGIWVCPP